MAIGASQLPAPAVPPEIYDIGIVSVSDDQKTVDEAVGIEAEEAKVVKPEKGKKGEAETGAEAGGESEAGADAGSEASGEEEAKTGEEPKPKEEPDAITAAQKRIDTLSSALTNKDQHIDSLTQRLDALERGIAAQPLTAEKKPPVAPELEKFSFQSYEEFQEKNADATYEQYIDERTDAKFEHRHKIEADQRQADGERAAQDTAAAGAQAVLAENRTRMDQFTAQHPTFPQALKESRSPMTTVMEETMMRSKTGPAMAMFLAENPDEATRIASIRDSFTQAIEVVRIESHPDVVALAGKVWPNGAPTATPLNGADSNPTPESTNPEPKIKARRAAPPAPLEQMRGSVGKTREISDMTDTEDADEYIRTRNRQHREMEDGGSRKWQPINSKIQH